MVLFFWKNQHFTFKVNDVIFLEQKVGVGKDPYHFDSLARRVWQQTFARSRERLKPIWRCYSMMLHRQSNLRLSWLIQSFKRLTKPLMPASIGWEPSRNLQSRWNAGLLGNMGEGCLNAGSIVKTHRFDDHRLLKTLWFCRFKLANRVIKLVNNIK